MGRCIVPPAPPVPRRATLVAAVLVVTGVAGLPAAPADGRGLPAVGRCRHPAGHGGRRRRLPRRRLGPRPGHEPVRRAGRGPPRLLGRPDPHPLLRGHRGGDAVRCRRSVRLRMLDNGYRVDVEAVQGTLTWLLTGCVPPAPAPTPTPTATATPALTTSHAVAHDHPDPPGRRARPPSRRGRTGSCGSTTRPTASSCSGTSA